MEDAVIRAFVNLVAEQGYPATTMDQVAERANVAKTTVYRRWGSRAELMLDVHRSLVEIPEPPPDTGSLEGDLLALGRQIGALHSDPEVMRMLSATIGELIVNEELALVFREQLLEPRLDLLRAVFRRAVERGETSPDLDYDAFAHMIIGANMFRTMIAGRGFSQPYAETVLRAVLTAIAVGSRPERS
ncbi:MAG: TetR/AcrR family transcriptional regulator [Dehalococcoidia bacterium]